jgi:hypothetical protein
MVCECDAQLHCCIRAAKVPFVFANLGMQLLQQPDKIIIPQCGRALVNGAANATSCVSGPPGFPTAAQCTHNGESKMALPGFNADASLYVSSEQYRATGPVAVPTHAVAIPQVGSQVRSWFGHCPRGCSQSEDCCSICDEQSGGFGHVWHPGPPARCLLF